MFLKKIYKYCFIILSICFILNSGHSDELSNKEKDLIIEKLYNFEEFSADFIQTNDTTFEEGVLYIKNKRIKIQYNIPTKIEIIIAKNKAMYFNKDLQEVEYFNPQKNLVGFFYQIFYDKNFFNDANFYLKSNLITISKKLLIEKDENEIEIQIILEDSPQKLRKIKVYQSTEGWLTFGIMNINQNPDLENKFFSMANPTI